MLYLRLYFLEPFQILFVGHDSVKQIKLLISVMEFLVFDILWILCIEFVWYDFSVALNNEPYNFKEGKFLSLFFSEVFTIKFDKFEENGFEEEFSLFDSLINIH